MGYEIVRLFALDWAATVAALHAKGDDFFWPARDANADNIDYTRIPFVAEYDGALSTVPGWRDPSASQIYDALREHLDAETRSTCDLCFSRLFWEGNAPALIGDLMLPDNSPPAHVWNALAPPSVRDVLGLLQRLPWQSLHAAADRHGGWENNYLPTIDDFDAQVGCHQAFLVEAVKRNAGVLALVSA